MNNSLFNILVFAAGAAIGSAVTYTLVKKKYERIADEEIASVKEVYARRAEKQAATEDDESEEEEASDEDETVEKPSDELIALAKILTDNKYYEEEKGGDVPMEKNEPVIITEEEFGKKEGYETLYLICFADKVVSDHDLYEISDPEEIVGEETLGLIDEYDRNEDDDRFYKIDTTEEEEIFLYVRNNDRKMDIEILFEARTYEEAMESEDAPHRVAD